MKSRAVPAGEKCKAEQRTYEPRVDRSRCEGKAECASVCPYEVFEVRRIEDADYRELPMLARFKVWAHGKQSAYTPRADRCLACGLCVAACPEGAITLVKI